MADDLSIEPAAPEPPDRKPPDREVPEEAIDELATALMAAWAKAEPTHSITKHPVSYVATFVDLARAAYPLIAGVRAEERQRIAAMIERDADTLNAFAPGCTAELIAYLVGNIAGAAGSAVPVATPDRPEIVVLCGSTRFKDAFREAARSEALAGRIVLTVSDLDPRPEMRHVNVPIDAETKARLDELHRHKIDLADRVLVLNVSGYIGESTRSEIEYATAHGKPITYLEPDSAQCEHNCSVAHVDSSFITGAEVRCPRDRTREAVSNG